MKTIVRLSVFFICLMLLSMLCSYRSDPFEDSEPVDQNDISDTLRHTSDDVEEVSAVAPCSTSSIGVKSLSVESPPHKTSYKAFEHFRGDGLVVSVHYENGTSERIGADSLEVIYANGKCFLAGDTSVTLAYGGRWTTVDVTVKRANYDMSGVSFVSSEYVYDGDMHYPKIKGRMPEGEDGITLEYNFLSGVTHVDEGSVDVVVSFSTSSKNYNVPENMRASVKILPRGINVIWGETALEYNGGIVAPEVYAKETELEVYSEAISVGRYYAVAVSKNNDYYVIDNRCEFTVNKAKNYWETPPEATECYEGKTPELRGKSRFGNIEFSFYSDASCKKRITPPFSVGTYYAVANVSETANYSSLSSEPFSFRVVEIVPVGLAVRILPENLVAFGGLSDSDYDISLLYNDGSESPIDKSSVSIIYENGDGFRQMDRTVKFVWDEYEKSLEVNVNYADYDLSAVKWIDTEQIYDGKPKIPSLIGLPDGVTVKEYIGGGVSSGEYTVSAVIEYDEENYNRPNILSCKFTVEKQTVSIPIIETVYNSEAQTPRSDSDVYFITSREKFENAGEYKVQVELADPANYRFEGSEDAVGTAIFRILPRTVEVVARDVDIHLFEAFRGTDFSGLTEATLYGDVVDTEQRIDGERVVILSLNPNYTIKTLGGQVVRLPYPTVFGGIMMLIIIGLLSLLIFLFVKKREMLLGALAVVRCRWNKRGILVYPPRPMKESISTTEKDERFENSENTSDELSDGDEIAVVGFGVDEERADALITDSLAKDLIKKDGDLVYTSGNGKATVTTEELSNNFSVGDRVDINVLKEKSLVPSDAFQVKIVAGGMLDKALSVYANDFTLTAVKMINLEGGDTVKVTSVRERNTPEADSPSEE